MSADDIIASAFAEGRPCVLFLGQDAWTTRDRTDPVLALFLAHVDRPPAPRASWRDVLTKPLIPEAFEWVTERFERNVIAEGIQDSLDLGWSAVFTSSIDPRCVGRLETHGRQPEAIVAADQYPRVARSTSRLPVHFLFGRSNEISDTNRCPRSLTELARRESRHATILLSRLGETVTAAGILVIDGFAPDRDWLRADALLSAIPCGEGMRVVWCGASGVPESPLLEELRTAGTLILEPRRLADIVSELRAHGRIEHTAATIRHTQGIISLSSDEFVSVSPALRLRVEASATIVDDDWTQHPLPLDPIAHEEAFRRFHGDLGGPRTQIEGIARGFAIERPFEKVLRQRVRELLDRRADLDRILVVHGQSGTGKSLAFARLAHVFRTEIPVPVLISAARLPEATDVDAFCAEAERQGANMTLVLCDGNLTPERYLALSRALRSRGRRAAVLGTTYRLELSLRHPLVDFIEAPTVVTPTERDHLMLLLRHHAAGAEALLAKLSPADAEHVFALLYRVLSPGRPRLVSGMSGEARAVEDALRQRALRVPLQRGASQLAQQLVAARLHDGAIPMFEVDGASAFGTDAPGRLIDYVMATGRLNVYVPLNLLMRVLRARVPDLSFAEIGELFRDLDLFRWKYGDEEHTELLLGPRLQLEAELICRRRLSDREREADCIIDLISGVRPRGVDQSSELRFLLDILQKLGRDGPRRDAYAGAYLRIAQVLTTLRTDFGLEDAALMLQESNFRRAWLRNGHDFPAGPAGVRDQILDEARGVVETAIERIRAGQLRAARRTRENLFVERASIYGFLAVGHSLASASADIVWSDYLAARAATRSAMSVAPSYFPFDVALWTPADILENAQSTNALSVAQRAELVADIHTVLDQVDPGHLPPNQLERFHQRRHKIGEVLADGELSTDALRALEHANPPLAIFLEARAMSSDVFAERTKPLSAQTRSQALRAVTFLRTRMPKIGSDVRCLRLLLDLEWVAATGERLLRGERRPLPHDAAKRDELLRLVRDLHAASGDAVDFALRYVEAVLSWVCHDVQRAGESWRAIARDTDLEDNRRVYRRLFVADMHGNPVLHRGRLIAQRSEGHWQLEVDGVPGRVELLERDFRGILFKKGYEIRDFAVAFNYLGPIADPLSRYEVSP